MKFSRKVYPTMSWETDKTHSERIYSYKIIMYSLQKSRQSCDISTEILAVWERTGPELTIHDSLCRPARRTKAMLLCTKHRTHRYCLQYSWVDWSINIVLFCIIYSR